MATRACQSWTKCLCLTCKKYVAVFQCQPIGDCLCTLPWPCINAHCCYALAAYGMQELRAGTWLNISLLAGGGLSGTLYYMFQHHPDDPNRPLIDYRLSLVLTPSVLVGSTIGASLT